MISANECIFVVLKSRMNSVKHSLNSESTPYQNRRKVLKIVMLTNNRLKAIIAINSEAGLAW
jgi:hypothetical protein